MIKQKFLYTPLIGCLFYGIFSIAMENPDSNPPYNHEYFTGYLNDILQRINSTEERLQKKTAPESDEIKQYSSILINNQKELVAHYATKLKHGTFIPQEFLQALDIHNTNLIKFVYILHCRQNHQPTPEDILTGLISNLNINS